MKVELPTQLHDKHHLLFSFYHVTCDINAKTNAKRKEALETAGELAWWREGGFWDVSVPSAQRSSSTVAVGYSWLPLLREGRLSSQEFNISVSCNLPPGYLTVKEAGSTKVRRAGPWGSGHFTYITISVAKQLFCLSPPDRTEQM